MREGEFDNFWTGGPTGQRRIGEVVHPVVKRWCRRCGCRLNSHNTTEHCSLCRGRIHRGAKIKEALR